MRLEFMLKLLFSRSCYLFILFMFALLWGCRDVQSSATNRVPVDDKLVQSDSMDVDPERPAIYRVREDVALKNYLIYISDLVEHLQDSLNIPLDEYALIHHNPWILDTLVATDYYHLKEGGRNVTDPLSLIILRKGDTLHIPTPSDLVTTKNRFSTVMLDLNIPEFTLRIVEEGEVLHSLPVRVGRVEKKYLAMAGREVDLRTRTGEGAIVRVNRNPEFINPVDNHRYRMTRRDDGVMTTLPNVPWIEPELDGQRHGQLIHPTTNLATLGKAYSNGCVGLREGDMWVVYYHAPIGTRVIFRYDLQGDWASNGAEIKDIYPGTSGLRKSEPLTTRSSHGDSYCDCRALE